MENNQQLEERIRQLSAELDEMRSRMGRLESQGRAGADGQNPKQDRRGFLRLAAGAALGAAGVAAGKVLPVAAANGTTVTTGGTFTEENSLIISDDSASGTAVPVFGAQAKTFTPATLTATGETFFGPLQGLGGSGGTDPNLALDTAVDGVDGFAAGFKAFGVYGLTDVGVGVVGESSTGVGLYSRASGRILQDPRPAGKPNFTGNDCEIVRDANGAVWASIPAGVSTVGWVQLAAMTLFPDPRRVWNDVSAQGAGTFGPIDATTKVGGGATGVPAGASAAFCAVQSYSSGVMTLFPDGAADPGIANWSGVANGPLNLLYMFVPLSSAGKFKMHAYFTGRRFVDVWGFIF